MDSVNPLRQWTNNFEDKILYVLKERLWLFQRCEMAALVNESQL